MENSLKHLLFVITHSSITFSFLLASVFVTNAGVEKAEALMIKPVAIQTVAAYKAERKEYFSKAKHLTDVELLEVLTLAGFEGKALRTAWAVSKAESNGRPKAHNGNRKTGDNSYGIFQVNMLGNLGKQRRDKFNLTKDSNLFDPIKNAKIAYYMTNKGTNWSSWSAYGNSRYKYFYKKFPKVCLKVSGDWTV